MVEESLPAKIGIYPNNPDDTLSEALHERIERLETMIVELRETSLNDAQIVERVLAQLREQDPDHSRFPQGLAADHTAQTAGLVPASVAGIEPEEQPEGARFWRWLGTFREFPTMLRMYFDSRYRLSRMGQLTAPVLVGLMVLNYVFFSFWSVPILAPIFERLLLVILAVLLYKVLARETIRYSSVLKYLSHYGR